MEGELLKPLSNTYLQLDTVIPRTILTPFVFWSRTLAQFHLLLSARVAVLTSLDTGTRFPTNSTRTGQLTMSANPKSVHIGKRSIINTI